MRSHGMLVLAGLLGSAAAGGVAIINNRAEASSLLARAVHVPEGDYLVESVGNGDKTLRSASRGRRAWTDAGQTTTTRGARSTRRPTAMASPSARSATT